MKTFGALLLAALAGSTFASPSAPAPTKAPDFEKRATTCTFSGSTGASQASVSQKSCSTIVLSDVAVPSGVTLDLGSLNDNTHVRTSLVMKNLKTASSDRQLFRSSSRALPPGDTRNGAAHSSASQASPSLSMAPGQPSMLKVLAGGTVRAQMERRSQSSSTHMI